MAPPPTPVPPPAEAVSDPAGLVGTWTGEVEGLTEVWAVRCVGGRWEVVGASFEGAREVGSFVGSDVRLSGRNLTFLHRFVKRPPRGWLDGTTHDASLVGGTLAYTWRFGASSGTRRLTRVVR